MGTASSPRVVAYGSGRGRRAWVLVGDEAFEADRASGVDLGGGDADFCAEAVAEAVSEAGGGILDRRLRSRTSAMKRLAAASFSS